ncbi:MAG: hypothetical protein A2099_05215 [Planctomycetes bacterium GWF2_39_10]|nr:MAG: hypothetical protein A2099_05215 [Planctomycetes bacterium GWF2_39_10]
MNKMKLIITIFLSMLVALSLLLPIKSANSQSPTKNQKLDALVKDLISNFRTSGTSFSKVVSSDKKNTTFYWNGQFSSENTVTKNDKDFVSWIKGEWDVKITAKFEGGSLYSVKSVSFKIPIQYYCWEQTNGDVEPIKYISEDYQITLDSKNFDLSFNFNDAISLNYECSFIVDYNFIRYIFLKYNEQEVFTTPKGGKFKLGGNSEGYGGGFYLHSQLVKGYFGSGLWPNNTDFQPPDGYYNVYDDSWYNSCKVKEAESSSCNNVTFLDEEDTSREVSGAAADGASQVVIQISNLCDNISEKDIKITIPESDGTLGKKEFKDSVFTQIWKAPENFVGEGNADDLKTGKRDLDFQITINGEEVAAPDFYLFKPPVVLVHGIWANAGSLKSMLDYLGDHYSEWVYSFTYSNSLHFADNVATVGRIISGTINTMKNQGIEGLENPIVVKKADVVAHSMGGILTGLYVASNDYENNINRLVTIGTPHSGSEMANFTLHFLYNEMTSEERTKLFNSLFYRIFKNFGGVKRSFTDGALEDLQVGSSAMEDYRKGWQNVQKVPVYAIQGKPQGGRPSFLIDFFVYGGEVLSEIPIIGYGVGFWYWDSWLDISTKPYFEGADASLDDWVFLYDALNIEAGLFGSKNNSDFVVSLKSQKGGSSAYDTIEVEDHTTETDDSEVQEKVAELLNSSIDKFDKNGFSPPADYTVPEVGVVTIDQKTDSQRTYGLRTLKEEGTSTSKLIITSPEEGKVFSPGDTVTVEVSYDGQLKYGIYFLSQDGSTGVDDSAPYEFQFQIDEEYIGSMLIVVWAVNEEGGTEEGGVEISIETKDKPESISITPSGPVYIERGSEVMLYVEGTYPDGVTRDITSHVAGTSYSSADSSIASATEDGVITAVSVGETTITVENGVSAEYKVYVLSCNAKKISVSEKTLTLKRKESKNVTVTLTGNDGCLSEGKTVTASINKAGQKRITISSTSTAVDSNGQAVFTITANNKKTGKAKVAFGSGKLKKSLTVKITK